MVSLTEQSLNKLSKQELVAMMLKMQNKMESLDTKFAEEVRKLNESFQQLKYDLYSTWNGNMWRQRPSLGKYLNKNLNWR